MPDARECYKIPANRNNLAPSAHVLVSARYGLADDEPQRGDRAGLAGVAERAVQALQEVGREQLELLRPDRRPAGDRDHPGALGDGLRLRRDRRPGDLRPGRLDAGEEPGRGGAAGGACAERAAQRPRGVRRLTRPAPRRARGDPDLPAVDLDEAHAVAPRQRDVRAVGGGEHRLAAGAQQLGQPLAARARRAPTSRRRAASAGAGGARRRAGRARRTAAPAAPCAAGPASRRRAAARRRGGAAASSRCGPCAVKPRSRSAPRRSRELGGEAVRRPRRPSAAGSAAPPRPAGRGRAARAGEQRAPAAVAASRRSAISWTPSSASSASQASSAAGPGSAARGCARAARCAGRARASRPCASRRGPARAPPRAGRAARRRTPGAPFTSSSRSGRNTLTSGRASEAEQALPARAVHAHALRLARARSPPRSRCASALALDVHLDPRAAAPAAHQLALVGGARPSGAVQPK